MSSATLRPVAQRRALTKRILKSLPWYPFIIINLVVFVVFNLWPWLSMFQTATFKTDLLSHREFVGLDNFVKMAGDELLHLALKNTFLFALLYVPPLVVVSLLVAILVNQKLRGMKFFRSVYFLPNVTNIAVLALVFRRFLSPRDDAPFNYLLGLVGIPAQRFLLDIHQALASIAGLGVWQSFGFFMVIWLAALQAIPQPLYDAGRVDGAYGWRLHRHVTIPLLRPTAAFVVVITTIGALQEFGAIFILTGGGPVNATTTAVYHIYSQAFNFTRFGYASALSILLFLIILVIAYIQNRYLKFDEEVY
ncbi:MAG: sugar ABC transporter permease [Caldilineaceae bacterium SB0665_bin_21]|nr:sugar ABC transporter permease [Caldilineaceae bacterium SB0665_bin_21]MYC63288.1 sugar ABC transporter permease [Caldilineaceae bacterium SB0661_bin_34]